MRGRFLVIEGIDGCGKTTQIEELYEWLPVSGLMPKGVRLQVTCEPGGTTLGKVLRKILLNSAKQYNPEALAELLLYEADRAQHIEQVIRPALIRGDWVLSDRFCGSTVAYQGYGREFSLPIISQLETIVTNGLTPDLTLWLALSPEAAIVRLNNRTADRMEANGITFLEQVAAGFEVLAYERLWTRIPAQHSKNEVSDAVKGVIKTVFSSIET
uniref:dTMP kinase n=1 Tax=Paulinella longichromatophora TaxID=1708747 RepID=A0A2H4ZP29_9EUKA|nr:thymidylate kinase [Paulinella longichromatophora]